MRLFSQSLVSAGTLWILNAGVKIILEYSRLLWILMNYKTQKLAPKLRRVPALTRLCENSRILVYGILMVHYEHITKH